jgi:MFS family permease
MIKGAVETFRTLDAGARRALLGTFLASSVDTWDLYLPAVVLPVALGYFVPPHFSGPARATLTYVILVIGVLAQPVSGPLFGSWNDTIGRRRATLIGMTGFSVVTLCIVILPGYATWGLSSLVLLVLLRLLGGVFLGGAKVGLAPLVMEKSPREARGLVSGLLFCGSPAAFVVFTGAQAALLGVAGQKAYTQWGWRVPFVLGVIYGMVAIVYYSRMVGESEVWQRERDRNVRARHDLGLRGVVRGSNLRALLQVFLVMSGLVFNLQVVVSVLPSLLITILHRPSESVTISLVRASFGVLCASITAGFLSQRLGRRRMLMAAGVWTALLVTALYGVMVRTAQVGVAMVFTGVFVVLCQILTMGPWGMVNAYVTERFPTGVRGTGFGIAFLGAGIIPALYSFYLLGLSSFMPYEYTELVLLFLGGSLLFIGATLGPDTRNVDMWLRVTERPPVRTITEETSPAPGSVEL